VEDNRTTTTVPMGLTITAEVEVIKAADVPAWRASQEAQKEEAP
jgi:hypothetical protein